MKMENRNKTRTFKKYSWIKCWTFLFSSVENLHLAFAKTIDVIAIGAHFWFYFILADGDRSSRNRNVIHICRWLSKQMHNTTNIRIECRQRLLDFHGCFLNMYSECVFECKKQRKKHIKTHEKRIGPFFLSNENTHTAGWIVFMVYTQFNDPYTNQALLDMKFVVIHLQNPFIHIYHIESMFSSSSQ